MAGVADRTVSGLACAVATGGLRFTWDRYTDWRTTIKPEAGAEYLYAERILWQVALSASGAFAGEETTHLIPSVSDGRGYVNFTEAGGVADPDETAFVRMLASGTRWVRARLVRLDSAGAIADAGAWSASVSGSYDAAADPEWVNRAWTRPAGPDLAGVRVLFSELWGGSLSTGANQAAYLKINLGTYNTADSVPAYFAALREALAARIGTPHRGKFGFFARAECGISAIMTGETTADEWYQLQGGRNPFPQTESDFNAKGGGTSPAMLLPYHTRDAALAASGSTQARLLSLTEYAEAHRGAGVYVHYLSLYGAAHQINDDTAGAPSDADILRSYCVPWVVDGGGMLCLDVFWNAVRYNTERGAGVETPEARLVRACVAERVYLIGERLGKTTNESYWRTLAGVGSTDSLSLLIDDGAYSTARAAADDGDRIDLSAYIETGETDPADLHARAVQLVYLNASTCAYVAAGSDNAEKARRLLIVARDLWHTWEGKAIPALGPQNITDDIEAADFDDFIGYTDAIENAKPAVCF